MLGEYIIIYINLQSLKKNKLDGVAFFVPTVYRHTPLGVIGLEVGYVRSGAFFNTNNNYDYTITMLYRKNNGK